ncbi:hypothetical protein MGA447_1674 [Enterococcus faecalis]|nr:hypothetical protein MGA447_1674 [Enterococcus faecalis]
MFPLLKHPAFDKMLKDTEGVENPRVGILCVFGVFFAS